ncbi:sensor histidine kinase [Cellulomonas composti]|uniref:histidine kinase n=1 Tax=Cellulomonas composti TaxID=266130 RepID=A0A511JD02_9CELL|nr:ATP-binding protein [Cellulomonas composti]GEL95878.1 hypothetical protein CCO02nite_25360 [Cellulomonas composti]
MTEAANDRELRPGDAARDRRVLTRATAIVALGYALGASTQAAYIYARFVPEWDTVDLWRRIAANFAGVLLLVLALAVLRVHLARRAVAVVGGIVAAALACTVARYLAQVALGIYAASDPSSRDSELISGFVVGVISTAIGWWALTSRRRTRVALRRAEREAVHVEIAARAIEAEEIRVRREVAEGLHGTLQSRIVLLEARITDLIARGERSGWEGAGLDSLREIRAELDEVREIDVRHMSRLLYPDRLEHGVVPAVRALLGRVPASIATRFDVDPAVRERDDPERGTIDVATRLLAVRVVEEGVTNGLKNGPASTVTVALRLDGEILVVLVENDGPLYDAATAGALSGTARLRDRVELVGGTLTLGPGDGVGARLQARIPLLRPVDPAVDDEL